MSAYSYSCISVKADDSGAEYIQSSVLMEAESGQIIINENGCKKVPVGTLVKMMTVLLTAEAIENGDIDADTMVTASPYANSMKQATIWLMAGEKMSVSDLLKSVIIGNANDASVALAEKIYGSETDFVMHMNTRAFELGMHDTVYVNCTGYDDERAYSTACDTALLARELIKHDILVEYMTTWHDYVRGQQTELVNENVLSRTYEGMLGVKAGHSQMSGNCIAFAASQKNQTFISVVLGCSDEDERFSIAKKLINTGFAGYQTAVPNLRSEYILPVRVKGGMESAVSVRTDKLPVLSVPKGRDDDISCVIIIPRYINAPVHKNQKIGSACFYLDDTLLCSTDIMTENDVPAVTIINALEELYIKLLK